MPKKKIKDVFSEFAKAQKYLPRPCIQLLYCPYGSLVEQFPLHEKEMKYAEKMGWYLDEKGKECKKNDKDAFPDIDRACNHIKNEKSCSIFGHDCPFYTCAEPFVDNK